jgi:hypothetical protein
MLSLGIRYSCTRIEAEIHSDITEVYCTVNHPWGNTGVDFVALVLAPEKLPRGVGRQIRNGYYNGFWNLELEERTFPGGNFSGGKIRASESSPGFQSITVLFNQKQKSKYYFTYIIHHKRGWLYTDNSIIFLSMFVSNRLLYLTDQFPGHRKMT